jgi:diaminopimelate decarboxylase
MNPFHYKDNQLFCENVPVERVAEETGTPFYLYSRSYLLDRFHAYERGFGNHPSMICFAVKSNSNLAVINTLAEVGAGADIVSGGELFRALRAGFRLTGLYIQGLGRSLKR